MLFIYQGPNGIHLKVIKG